MDPTTIARRQHGVIAHWQLIAAGLTVDAARHWARGLRRPFDGVYVTGLGPITQMQLWWAATLTTPTSVLCGPAATVFHGLRDRYDGRITIVRPGDGGPVDDDGLLVRRSRTLGGHVLDLEGFRVTTVERTIVDEWGRLRWALPRQRLVREALRTEATTSSRLLRVIGQHRGARGVAHLRAYVRQYSHLPFARCRSDAECQALVVLDDAGVRTPLVNVVVAGHEADLVFPDLRRIIEVDGPQFHRLTDRDRIKEAAWRAAGYTVDRVPSGDVYDAPHRLLAVAPPPNVVPAVP